MAATTLQKQGGRNFPCETVTRREAARRQISTAITLILGNGDAVSANVLAWAATEMLRGVAADNGISTLNALIEDLIKPEFIQRWRNTLKDHYNYFKHADLDPTRVITDFSPEATTWVLYGACFDYAAIYNSRTWAMFVYESWFVCRHPEIIDEEARAMVRTMSRGLDFPSGKPLPEAVKAAYGMLEDGRKHPELLSQVGPTWLANLETE